MSDYNARDAARLVGLAEREVRAMMRAGLLDAREGKHERLTFQDLVLLRTAKDLRQQQVPAAAVRRALRQLRSKLPSGTPLSALPMQVHRGRVVVRDGDRAYDAESGQCELVFERDPAGSPADGSPTPFHIPLPEELCAEDWYEVGFDLEEQAEDEAVEAYRRALELDPDHFDAHINLGRLYVIRGDLAGAEAEFRAALREGPHAIALFNLGVVLEERGAGEEACDAYRKAIATDPHCAEAYFNLARLVRIMAEAKKILEQDEEAPPPAGG